MGARGISLMYSTLCWNPAWRSSAQESLKHSYFRLNSQPSSASSNHHTFALALKPTARSRRSVHQREDQGGGVRVPVPLIPVEAVYDRDGLRNYKDDSAVEKGGGEAAFAVPPTVVTQKDQEDLKLLLESLQSNDVMAVVAPPAFNKKINVNNQYQSHTQQHQQPKLSNGNNNNFAHQQQQLTRLGHRPSFLNFDGEEPIGVDSLTINGGGGGRVAMLDNMFNNVN